MIHLRHNPDDLPGIGKFICGLDVLPPGHQWFYCGEAMADVRADCPGCNPNPRRLGTPISELTGRNGGNAEWRCISQSWGFD